MNTTHGILGTRRLGAILLPALLALLIVQAKAPAQDVSGNIGGTPLNGTTGADLTAAVDEANRVARAAGTDSTNVVLNVDTDQNLTSSSQFGGWSIHGNDAAPPVTDPTSGTISGFDSVTVRGASGGGVTTLSGNDSHGTVLSIMHANAITVERLKITSGNYSPANTAKSEIAGGGLLLGGNGFASANYHAPATIDVRQTEITGNTLAITAGSTTDNLFGAGVAVNGIGVSGGSLDTTNTSVVNFSNVDITDNTLSYTRAGSASDQDASIRGGGGRIGYAKSFTYSNGTVSGNVVTMTGGDHAAGGGLSIDGGGTYQDVGATPAVTISGVTFSDNSVTKSGATISTQDGYARGGGLYYYNGTAPANHATVLLNGGTVFDNNSVTAGVTGSSRNANAEGGAAFVMLDNTDLKVDGVKFTDNSATSTKGRAAGGAIMADMANAAGTVGNLAIGNDSLFKDNFATGTTAAYGGAVAVNYGATVGEHSIDQSIFTGNIATAGSINGRALGGAVYFAGGGNKVTNSTISGNKADGGLYAKGGGLYLGSGVNDIKNVVITGNVAQSKEYAQGGGIFAEGGVLNIANSTITDNRATVEDYTDRAYGSAIYMDTATTGTGLTTASVNLEATNAGDRMVIENNKTNNDHRVSGIHFGNSEGALSLYDAKLNITGEGEVVLNNPVTAMLNNSKKFAITKTGNGNLSWDGRNEFNVVGGTEINLSGGRISLGKDFTAKGSGGGYTVEISNNLGQPPTEVWFDTARDETLAMFDFSDAASANFRVDADTKLVASVGRQVKSSNKEYVVASGLDAGTLDELVNNFDYVTDGSDYLSIDNELKTRDDKLLASVNFRSPFDNNTNSYAAQDALESLVQGEWGKANISDAEYYAMLANARNVTPELFMEQGYVMMDSVDRISRSAVDFGLRYPHRARMKEEGEYMSTEDMIDAYGHSGAYSHYAYPSLAGYDEYCDPSGGARIWAGYVGDWRNMDGHGGYNGYRLDRNGVLVGMNYDFGTMASVGVYGGYTKSNTKAQHAESKVRSDVGHVGVQARWSPLTADRGLSFFVDGGYHWSSNDIQRNLGGWTATGSYDQDAIGVGFGAEYVAQLECLSIVPHFEGRYFNVDQDGMRETGSSATITRIEGFEKSGFNTRLGVELTRDYMLGCVTFSPAVNIDWRHEYGSQRASAAAIFVNDPFASPFSVTSSRQDRDSLDLGFSLKTYRNFGTSQIGFNVAYNLNWAKNSDTHSVYAGMEYGF